MSIELVAVDRMNEDYYTEKAVELLKYHKGYAEILGINDKVVDAYTKEDAKKHFNDNNFRHYIIVNGGKNIGILQINLIKSDIDDEECIHISKIWSDGSYKGVLRGVIGILRNKFKEVKSIELECWYNLPANEVYKHIGFKSYCTLYRLDIKD